MDSAKIEHLSRLHQDLMHKARNAVEEAGRRRNEMRVYSKNACVRSKYLRGQATEAASHAEEVRIWTQDVQARTIDSISASQAAASRLDRR